MNAENFTYPTFPGASAPCGLVLIGPPFWYSVLVQDSYMVEVLWSISLLKSQILSVQLRFEDTPRGPSTSMVFEGITLKPSVFRFGGSRSVKFTSGGSNRGALPIRDSHLEEVENDRDRVVVAVKVAVAKESAGTRKSGGRKVFLENDLRHCIE